MGAAPFATWEGSLNPPYLVPGRDDDLHDATYWALHMALLVDQDDYTPPQAAELFRASGCEALTGDFCGGDDAWQWGEPNTGAQHFVIYLWATAEHAERTARALIDAVCVPDRTGWHPIYEGFTLTTALDWSLVKVAGMEWYA